MKAKEKAKTLKLTQEILTKNEAILLKSLEADLSCALEAIRDPNHPGHKYYVRDSPLFINRVMAAAYDGAFEKVFKEHEKALKEHKTSGGTHSTLQECIRENGVLMEVSQILEIVQDPNHPFHQDYVQSPLLERLLRAGYEAILEKIQEGNFFVDEAEDPLDKMYGRLNQRLHEQYKLEKLVSKDKLNLVFQVNSDLEDAAQENPVLFAEYWLSLYTRAPKVAADPVLAGAVLREMILNPDTAGKVLYEYLK